MTKLTHFIIKNIHRAISVAMMSVFIVSTGASVVANAVPAYADEPLTREDINASRASLPVATNAIEGWAQGPAINSESAVLMDADSGMILYDKNMDEEHFPASTTKVMTCLLAAELCNMDEVVKFSSTAVHGIDPGSSNVGIDVGQTLTMEEAIYCVMLASANEAASAIAEHISGSTEAFADLMNERAKELGCTSTHFCNANGLPNDEHLTTAHDLALIARAFDQNETCRRIASSKSYTVNATDTQPDTFTLYNHHQMFPGFNYGYENFVWGKTGYTNVARSTLVTAAEKDGMKLIAVVMKAEPGSQYTDTRDLFDYGFQNFQKLNIAENETHFNLKTADFFSTDNTFFGNTQALLSLDPSGYVMLPKTIAFSDLDSEITYSDDKGDKSAATINYYYKDNFVGSTDVLMSIGSAERAPFSPSVSDNDIVSANSISSANAPGFQSRGMIYISLKNLFLYAGIVVGSLLLIIFMIFAIHNYLLSDIHKRRKIKKERRYSSEFDKFDF